ncbi:DUF362 domain-containing protein [Desulfovibrio legallii]|uniref:Uncharacterized conserved protein, DUF362 family n=1 Tax=Desulfovibrio legallii TaxID=571438 RepID=A0A1G7ISA0_9BACT|nr:DUF362 domain-containing protein [Desulfovibrio legallii]SDF15547.1 Uncharacterized conserved protein, DUF362 family [Desulfovibrio legallii]
MTAPAPVHAPLPVALTRCQDYTEPTLSRQTGAALDAARLTEHISLRGARVLVKPNLLQAKALACTTPAVVAAACAWLMDQGARVTVADAPGFGRAAAVARAVGLEAALKPLGLAVRPLETPVPTTLPLLSGSPPPHGRAPRFGIARLALESDAILSLPRVKAHSQMLLTLAVKNCFGCVCGLRKAVVHAREGRDPDFFADCLAALWAALPPVAALADGVRAMHVTGPSKGEPFPLNLLGACASAPALDEALCAVLGRTPSSVPLGAALIRRQAPGTAAAGCVPVYPLLRPEDFDAAGFVLPARLAHTSFHPARLLKSCARRICAVFRT